jgi:hypothetical protein
MIKVEKVNTGRWGKRLTERRKEEEMLIGEEGGKGEQ